MEIIKDDPKMISMETLKSRIYPLNMYTVHVYMYYKRYGTLELWRYNIIEEII